MTENADPARIRGFVLGALLLAVGLSAAATRYFTSASTLDATFFISLLATLGGSAIIVRVLRAPTDKAHHG